MASVLVVNFFPAFSPPTSGGELRLGCLYSALSREHDVTLLSSTHFDAPFEEIQHTPRFRELRFPKDMLWREAYATLNRWGLTGELSGLAFALAVSEPSCALRQRAHALAATADVVIHEFPFSEPIFADGCPCPEIYNSHNFEIALLSSIARGPGLDEALLKLMRLEANLVARARRVLAVSEDDARKFELFYGVEPERLGLCPNGFDEQALQPVLLARQERHGQVATRPRLLFIGSAHHPNVEAAQSLIDTARELPDYEFCLAGAVCERLVGALPANIVLLGVVDPDRKAQLLSEADLFLNPVVLGSGTSLKALEALAAGLPMLSTPEGARGLGLQAGVHAEIARREEFTAAVRRLLADPLKLEQLASSGRRYAQSKFAWERIAVQLGEQLMSTRTATTVRPPLLLALNDYPALERGSGGIARLRGVLSQLEGDVILLTFGATFEVALIGVRVLHVTVPKTAAHQAFQDALNAGQPMSANDAVASLFAAGNPLLMELVPTLALRASAVIFEHPYMAPLLDSIRAVRPELPVVYSAHNVERSHKALLLQGHAHAATLTRFIAGVEERLLRQADLIVCCTDADAQELSGYGAPAIVAANGCDLPEIIDTPVRELHDTTRRRVGFLGSAHGPNVEAGEFIVQQLAPAFPNVVFEFIGSVCGALAKPLPSNTILHGTVSETAKTSLMLAWDAALNPIESGGGSSLKLPDYMAHGVPSLSTPTGARGFAIAEQDAGIVIKRHRFAETLPQMLSDPAALARQRQNARRYAAQSLSWRAVTDQYRQHLWSLCHVPTGAGRRPRLLVVTYRYTEPALGGAEEYLIEILKRLRPQFERIDLAAVDLEHITNYRHFGVRFSVPAGGAARRMGRLFDCTRYFPATKLSEADTASRARRLEHAWVKEEDRLLAPFLPEIGKDGRLRLLGGVHQPENHGEQPRRWTSGRFSILVPPGLRHLHISGHAPGNKLMRATLIEQPAEGGAAGQPALEMTLGEQFSVDLSLTSSDSPRLLEVEVPEHEVPGDDRALGVLLARVSGWIELASTPNASPSTVMALQELQADLTERLDERLRSVAFGPWVSRLFEVAAQRDPGLEADFAAIRGPHSPALQSWVAAHAREYDTVLVQGIPFDVVPSTVETLKAAPGRPRIVVLPHFHGDDRFYYWRRYFDSFAAADRTVLFSASLAEALPMQHSAFTVLPGGGIRADELGSPRADTLFRAVHSAKNPFFLVLGRKTPSKNYLQAIAAHQQLRKRLPYVDLVLIGPDEDGRAVRGDGVFYLGVQPREVVQGALRSCLALVSMSRSESFGIVLCEAWLFGKPIIGSRDSYAFRELIQHRENGMLVSTDAELEQAMLNFASQPLRRARIGYSGYCKAISRFTWDRVACSWNSVLVAYPPANASSYASRTTALLENGAV